MKSYTDLEQSKKLAEILPIESADVRYGYIAPYDYSDRMHDGGYDKIPYPKNFFVKNPNFSANKYDAELPCWSLAAMLDQLEEVICDEDGNQYQLRIIKEGVQYYLVYDGMDVAAYYDTPLFDNLVDACVDMILKLHEQKLL